MKPNRYIAAAAILVVGAIAGFSPAFGAFWQWSKTSATNANADPTINWAEGMSPSSVNDSARAMMARAAEYRDDISGALNTTGSSTSYVVTTNQGFNATPTDGQLLAVTPSVTNDVGVQLGADGGNAYPIQSAPGVGIGGGTMVAGTPYTMKFSAANSAWMLRDFYGSPYNVPLGGILSSTVDTAPNSNFAVAGGQCISRTVYAAYFAKVGTRFGGCDGSTTFAMIDLRGRVPAGLDNLNGTSAGRLTSSPNGCGVTFTSVGAVCGNESQTLTIAQMPNHNHPNTLIDPSHSHTYAATLGLVGLNNGVFSITSAQTSNQTANAYTGLQISNGYTGNGVAHPIVQPVIAVTYFVRIL